MKAKIICKCGCNNGEVELSVNTLLYCNNCREIIIQPPLSWAEGSSGEHTWNNRHYRKTQFTEQVAKLENIEAK